MTGLSRRREWQRGINENCIGDIVEGLFDDNPEVKELCGVPVKHEYHGERPIIVSIGNNAIRKRIVERIVDGVDGSEVLGGGVFRVEGDAVLLGKDHQDGCHAKGVQFAEEEVRFEVHHREGST